MLRTANFLITILLSFTLFSCLEKEEQNPDCGDYDQTGSSLNLNSSCNLLEDIWGPGSNSIVLEGALNFSTQPGIGWSQEYAGTYVTSFSVVGETSHYIASSTPISVRIEGPENAIIEVFNLETLKVISSNINSVGSAVVFEAQPNIRYGGFAWYEDNAQMDIAIYAYFN